MAEQPYDGAEGRQLFGLIIPGMAVVDSSGTHIGVVEKVTGGQVKVALPGKGHHDVKAEWVVAVDDRVRLSCSLDEARRLWAAEHHIR
jgi:hypothetical protein